MSRKFLTHLDLVQNELQNAKVQNLGTAPTVPAPVKGQLYFNSTDNTLYWWDGAVWQSAKGGAASFPGYGAVAPEPTFGSAPADGVAATVSRSDHKHGNPTHDNAAHAGINLSALAPPTADVSMGGFKITSLGAPVALNDAVNFQTLQDYQAGLAWKDSARAGTTANITLSGTQTIDGVTLVAGNRVLVKNQTNAAENGIYQVNAGAWTRWANADTDTELVNAALFIEEGTTQADTAWVMTTNLPITVGTTPLTWVQFAGAGTVGAGAGLTQSGNTLNVGAGTGITVAADTVALDTTYTDGRYVNTTGDTLTGPLVLSGAPSGGNDATTKTYVDTAVAGALDQTEADARYVQLTRTISTTAPLTGGGDLTANRTLGISGATETATGAVELATTAEASAGTDTTRAVTPAGLAAALLTNTGNAKRYATDVGGAVSQVVTHNLNTLDTHIQVYRKASPFDVVECDMEHTSVNTATLRFTVAPAAAEYRVVVLA